MRLNNAKRLTFKFGEEKPTRTVAYMLVYNKTQLSPRTMVTKIQAEKLEPHPFFNETRREAFAHHYKLRGPESLVLEDITLVIGKKTLTISQAEKIAQFLSDFFSDSALYHLDNNSFLDYNPEHAIILLEQITNLDNITRICLFAIADYIGCKALIVLISAAIPSILKNIIYSAETLLDARTNLAAFFGLNPTLDEKVVQKILNRNIRRMEEELIEASD